MISTGEELRDYREGQKWSRVRLGQALGVSAEAVKAWENGRRPMPESAIRLATILETMIPVQISPPPVEEEPEEEPEDAPEQ